MSNYKTLSLAEVKVGDKLQSCRYRHHHRTGGLRRACHARF